MGERMLSLLMMRDTRVEDTWPVTESCSDTEDEATPLVRLPLVLPPGEYYQGILVFRIFSCCLTFAGVALDALHAGQEGGAAGARHPPGELPGRVEGGGGAPEGRGRGRAARPRSLRGPVSGGGVRLAAICLHKLPVSYLIFRPVTPLLGRGGGEAVTAADRGRGAELGQIGEAETRA